MGLPTEPITPDDRCARCHAPRWMCGQFADVGFGRQCCEECTHDTEPPAGYAAAAITIPLDAAVTVIGLNIEGGRSGER